MNDNDFFPENFWKGNRKAAVSLTYDDGYVSNLDNAIPQLEIRGFRGTFYLFTDNTDVQNNWSRWKQVFENGHEIGNHSKTHNCDYLSTLSKQQLNDLEVGAAEWVLNQNIGIDEDRTYAFPCALLGDGEFGQRYQEVVSENCIGSRAGGGGPNFDYKKLSSSSHLVEAQAIGYPHGIDAYPMIEYCKKALNNNGWAVLVFHGIGDNKMTTENYVHTALLDYLKDNEDKYWIAPFKDVAKYIRMNPKH